VPQVSAAASSPVSFWQSLSAAPIGNRDAVSRRIAFARGSALSHRPFCRCTIAEHVLCAPDMTMGNSFAFFLPSID
jgi:hypothetical protein